MKLPPLSAVPLPNGYPVEEHGHIAKFAMAYGLACAEAMREECAKACDMRGSNVNVHEFGRVTAMKCAAAIRAIKVER